MPLGPGARQIFNMFIVIPMMIQIFTLPLFYNAWLGGNPENVIRLAGSLLIRAAVAVMFVKLGARSEVRRTAWVAEPQPE